METEFEKELEHLINKHSLENGSNTPDFILAQYLKGCLDNFNIIIQARESWYGRGVIETDRNIDYDGTGCPPPQHPTTTSVEEFKKQGFLQEVNRCFLHPLGLALEVTIDDNGKETISGIWDSRDDLEGIIYDLKNSDEQRIKNFINNWQNVNNCREQHRKAREEMFGNIIEPIIK